MPTLGIIEDRMCSRLSRSKRTGGRRQPSRRVPRISTSTGLDREPAALFRRSHGPRDARSGPTNGLCTPGLAARPLDEGDGPRSAGARTRGSPRPRRPTAPLLGARAPRPGRPPPPFIDGERVIHGRVRRAIRTASAVRALTFVGNFNREIWTPEALEILHWNSGEPHPSSVIAAV